MIRDRARKLTDKKLKQMEKNLTKMYRQSEKEIKEKWNAYMERSASRISEMQSVYDSALKSGIKEDIASTKKALEEAQRNQTLRNAQYQAMVNETAERISQLNQRAVDYANGEMPSIYSVNYNQVEGAISNIEGISFRLLDESTVRYLASQNPELLPHKTLNRYKDIQWNIKKMNSAVTQGILQGESIPKIAKRLTPIVDYNRVSSIRNARTMTTSAENRGRLDSYKALEEEGLVIEKTWMATGDERTRETHLALDGTTIPINDEFSNGLMYPADPYGSPDEVWNCRCSLVQSIIGFKRKDGSVSYVENEEDAQSTIVEGHDISDTFERRRDEFSFEIEDVLNTQGFDGAPRIVDEAEFNEAVKMANGGNGFIAQRTYSAPDQETLDLYREQLYSGKFYVDCSVGGSQYGQGMYCAADYTGKITKGISDEMKHYQMLGSDRLGEFSGENLSLIVQEQKNKAKEILRQYKSGEISKEVGLAKYRKINSMSPSEYVATYMKDSDIVGARSYTETLTLDPSAKIGDYSALRLEMLKSGSEDTDVGIYAAKKGYDAINAEGHGGSGSYTVILNRTKLIIKRG